MPPGAGIGILAVLLGSQSDVCTRSPRRNHRGRREKAAAPAVTWGDRVPGRASCSSTTIRVDRRLVSGLVGFPHASNRDHQISLTGFRGHGGRSPLRRSGSGHLLAETTSPAVGGTALDSLRVGLLPVLVAGLVRGRRSCSILGLGARLHRALDARRHVRFCRCCRFPSTQVQ